MSEALKATGLKTKKDAVELGLKTLVLLKQQEEIRRFRGKLQWTGDLDELRSDSVWIDYFNGVDGGKTDTLDSLLGQQRVAIGDLILVEVLQGFRHDKDFRTAQSLFEAVTLFELP
ncbi:unnamed protein product, partial [Cyprideis torosa]